MPLTLKKFNQRPLPPKTFTISWTEQSNMSSGWTYSDDATGLTAGSTEFDKFFGYSGVRLSSAGVETAEITQENSGGYGNLDITQLGTLTSGNNVMIKFPVRGIKMTKSGSAVTLSITDAIGKESEGFQYYAFQNTGDIEANASTTVATHPLYLGTYLSCADSISYMSFSGKTPETNTTIGNTLNYSGANGTGWTIMGFYQRMYINALYMMKYGNPNSKSVIGRGYTGGGAKKSTGNTNSITSATYGTSSTTTQMKLFGLEDWYGNLAQMLGGVINGGSGYIYTALHDFTSSTSVSSQYKLAGTLGVLSYANISGIGGNNKLMFTPTSTVNNSSYNTYYCDYNVIPYNFARLGVGGAPYNYDKSSGVFSIALNLNTSEASSSYGSRLMYL